MTLAFIDLGVTELILIPLVAIVSIIAVGNYGKVTSLGYRGSVLLSLLTSPFVAFIIIRIIRSRENNR